MKVNRNNWARKLYDALSSYQTCLKTLINMSPYQLIFSKTYHFPVEIKHKDLCTQKSQPKLE